MITEDYVSFETAKLLKEKGFDELCPTFYETDEPDNGPKYSKKLGWFLHNSYNYSDRYGKMIISASTLQMAMKWLREEHSIHIMIDCIGAKNYIPTIQFTYFGKDIVVESNTSKIGGNGFDSNEEAGEAAIKYCLENLI